jgi:hypothetical protein
LQGLDAIDWFIVGNNYFLDNPGGKFNVGWPSMIGTFPAAAIVYRQGLVQQAPDVVHLTEPVKTLFEKGEGKVDPLAYYVGRVTREFDGASKDPGPTLSDYIDREKKVVRSQTGQLSWDWGNGLTTMNAPAAQGAAGYLKKAGRVELNDVAIESHNEFGQVMVVSLDGKPLAESRKVLVQAMTEEKPFGERTDGGVIEALGGVPIGVKTIAVTIGLKSWKEPVKVQPLDENGYPAGRTKESAADQIKLPERALQCILTR